MGEDERRRAAAEAADAFAKIYREWPEVPGPIPGKVTIMSVAHDDDCPGVGTGIGCTCNPVIRHFLYPTEQ
jgi:hypothetical protein